MIEERPHRKAIRNQMARSPLGQTPITARPPFNPSYHFYKELRDAFEVNFRDMEQLERYSLLIPEVYRQNQSYSVIKCLVQLLKESSGSRQMAAERLGVDPSVLSVAKKYGELGSRPLARLFILVGDEFLRNKEHHDQACRCGFIAAARETARFFDLEIAPTLQLNDANYELLCGAVSWANDNPIQSFAFSTKDEHLCQLQEAWLRPLSYTWAILEGEDD